MSSRDRSSHEDRSKVGGSVPSYLFGSIQLRTRLAFSEEFGMMNW